MSLNHFQLHAQLAADSIEIGDLKLCKLLLINDSQYPWFVLVPMRAEITEIYQLNETDRRLLDLESVALAKALVAIFGGDKLNVAALGNLVPQLHIHHIVRFKKDPAWPKPVWGVNAMVPYSNAALREIKEKITDKIRFERLAKAP